MFASEISLIEPDEYEDIRLFGHIFDSCLDPGTAAAVLLEEAYLSSTQELARVIQGWAADRDKEVSFETLTGFWASPIAVECLKTGMGAGSLEETAKRLVAYAEFEDLAEETMTDGDSEEKCLSLARFLRCWAMMLSAGKGIITSFDYPMSLLDDEEERKEILAVQQNAPLGVRISEGLLPESWPTSVKLLLKYGEENGQVDQMAVMAAEMLLGKLNGFES